MKNYIKITVFIALTSLAASAKNNPSFDCRKASTEVEKTICTSGPHLLGERDSLLGVEFKRAKESLVGNPKLAADLLTSQIEWADNRKFCILYSNSEKEACLLGTYDRRIAFLKAIASNTTSLVGNEVQPINCSQFAIGSNWQKSSLSSENSKKLYGYLSAEADNCWKQFAAYPEQRLRLALAYIKLALESELGCKEASQRFDEFALDQGFTVYLHYRLKCHLESDSQLIELINKRADSMKASAEENYQKLQTILLNSPLWAQIKKEHVFLENIFKTSTFLKKHSNAKHYMKSWGVLLKRSQALPHECGESGGDSGCVKLKIGSVKEQVTIQVHFLLNEASTNEDARTADVTAVEFFDNSGKIRLVKVDKLASLSFIEGKWTIHSVDCDDNGISYLVINSIQSENIQFGKFSDWELNSTNIIWQKYSVDTKNAKLIKSEEGCASLKNPSL
ncbi:MAG: hypothetical protein KBD76_16345 [Bacteriovorax sp.]|nr:hypothetical protein [Bacteriovorax sp.]